MADQLCLLADVKSRLKITDGTDDALLTSLIEGVSDWIQDATGRKLVAEAAATYVFDTIYGSEIEVRRGIRTVTTLSIAAADQPDTGGTYTVWTGNVYLRPVAADRRVGWPATTVILAGTSPALRTAINGCKIVGDFGFAAVPPAIAQLALDAVVSAYQTRGKPSSATIGVDAGAVFPWATFFSPGSPAARTVARFRGVYGVA